MGKKSFVKYLYLDLCARPNFIQPFSWLGSLSNIIHRLPLVWYSSAAVRRLAGEARGRVELTGERGRLGAGI